MVGGMFPLAVRLGIALPTLFVKTERLLFINTKPGHTRGFDMSQIKYFTTDEQGHNIEIMSGWDRPMNGYHLTVTNLDATEDDPTDGILYCQLDDEDFSLFRQPKSIDQLKPKLDALHLSVPEEFWDAAALRLGNDVAIIREEDDKIIVEWR